MPYAFFERAADGTVRDITEELPFEIPDSWEWVRLGMICVVARGGSPRPIQSFLTTADDGINWIKIGDTDKGGKYIYTAKEKIIPDGVSKSRMVHSGDFLLTNSMSFGRPYILKVDGCIHDGWLVLSDYQQALDIDFFFHALSSRFAYYQFCGQVSGGVVKNLNSEKVADSIFPLPPIDEQRRIVEKIESILPSIEKYDATEQRLSALNAAFPDALKKSILQAAVQGKLVSQDSADEPASALLDRIRAEKDALVKSGKVKRNKHESVIFRRDNSYYEMVDGIECCIDDEIPFGVPESWAWARLGAVVFNRGQMTPPSDFCYIDIGSIDNQHQRLNEQETIVAATKAPSRARKIVEQDDILYSTVRPYLHNMCIVDRPFSRMPIASTGFAVMTCHNMILNRYLFFYLLSPNFDSYANDRENSKGVAYPAINDMRLYKALVPLPSLAEQSRIVERIDELVKIAEML